MINMMMPTLSEMTLASINASRSIPPALAFVSSIMPIPAPSKKPPVIELIKIGGVCKADNE